MGALKRVNNSCGGCEIGYRQMPGEGGETRYGQVWWV